MSTYQAKPQEQTRNWHLVDAENKPLGRVASQIATILRGKNKPTFTPHVDGGDFVVVVNAEKVGLHQRTEANKEYHYHSGYVGGLRTKSAAQVREESPKKLLERAVWGMLPSNTLGRAQLKKLKIYTGTEHPHAAQKPQPLELA